MYEFHGWVSIVAADHEIDEEEEDDRDSPWPSYYDPDRDEVIHPGDEDVDTEDDREYEDDEPDDDGS